MVKVATGGELGELELVDCCLGKGAEGTGLRGPCGLLSLLFLNVFGGLVVIDEGRRRPGVDQAEESALWTGLGGGEGDEHFGSPCSSCDSSLYHIVTNHMRFFSVGATWAAGAMRAMGAGVGAGGGASPGASARPVALVPVVLLATAGTLPSV